jgi:hypothetical protein
MGGRGNAAKPTADDEGDVIALSTDLQGQLRTIQPDTTAVLDAAAPASAVLIGGKGNAAVPSADDEGDIVAASMDLRGVQRIMGDIAHDAADAGAPLKVGGTATAALQSAVTEGDRSQLSTDLYGQLRMMKQERSVTLHAAGAVTAGANDTAVTGVGPYTHAEFLLNVTAAAAVAGDTLDVFVDARPDGGTTWGAETKVNVVNAFTLRHLYCCPRFTRDPVVAFVRAGQGWDLLFNVDATQPRAAYQLGV